MPVSLSNVSYAIQYTVATLSVKEQFLGLRGFYTKQLLIYFGNQG